MNNHSFKLIAIRPTIGCHSKFLKNLKEGTIYKLYNEYSFKDNQEQEITKDNNNLQEKVCSVTQTKKVPDNMFNTYFDNNKCINVSAIVGKNGSGKSTLLELFYASCFVISCNEAIIQGNNTDNVKEKAYSTIEILSQFQLVLSHLEVEVYYLQGDTLSCLKISNENISIEIIYGENKKKYNLKDLFYTISVNYSLYGLNSETMDKWIHSLFHKNDGYETPLVITPYRHKGNINVNSELQFSQTRLLSNLLTTNSTEILENKNINTLILTLNENNLKEYNEELKKKLNSSLSIGDYEYTKDDILFEKFLRFKKMTSMSFFVKVYNTLYNDDKISQKHITKPPVFNHLCQYIFHKTIKISEKYYKSIAERSSLYLGFFSFLKSLKTDKSHITLKLRQTINSIRFNLLVPENDEWFKSKKNKLYHFKIEYEKLKKRIKSVREFNFEELIPIGGFSVKIWVKNGEGNNTVSDIDVLSSGEQHFIQSIQSIIYHIININSVFQRDSKIKYEYINIILDEIELYFHPEFQRTFLDNLLLNISKLNIPHIKGINFLFSTHSPFILSDIPVENTLKLEKGNIISNTNDENTLGANIHDLLDNDFYLNKGFMGEFTKKQIYELMDFLSNKEKKGLDKWNEKNALQFIELIGEPILKSTLRDLYFEKYSNKIDAEIERLIRLKNISNNDTN